MSAPSPRTRKRLRHVGVVLAMGLAHLVVLSSLSRSSGDLVLEPPLPSIEVVLIDPPPPPPPPPPAEAETSGGGAPAAPSVVRLPPRPVEVPPEIVAPPEPAPEQPPIVVGASNLPGETPAQGQGGQGTGTGGGQGSGVGPGAGSSGPRLLRGPSQAEIVRQYPRRALRERRPGRGVIACRIRLDTTLSDCRLVSEAPPGEGFGRAALAAAEAFRFRPPFENGRPVDGREVTVGVDFFPQ